jgi:hypothetical protein
MSTLATPMERQSVARLHHVVIIDAAPAGRLTFTELKSETVSNVLDTAASMANRPAGAPAAGASGPSGAVVPSRRAVVL